MKSKYSKCGSVLIKIQVEVKLNSTFQTCRELYTFFYSCNNEISDKKLCFFIASVKIKNRQLLKWQENNFTLRFHKIIALRNNLIKGMKCIPISIIVHTCRKSGIFLSIQTIRSKKEQIVLYLELKLQTNGSIKMNFFVCLRVMHLPNNSKQFYIKDF